MRPLTSVVKLRPLVVMSTPPCAEYGTCLRHAGLPVETSIAVTTPVATWRFGNGPAVYG